MEETKTTGPKLSIQDYLENDLEINRDKYRGIVERYLRELNNQGLIPRDSAGILHVLSVGCGWNAFEAEPILSLGNVQFKGIDLFKEKINMAREINRDLPQESFKVEDGTKLGDGEKNKYGLVIVRDPQVFWDDDDQLFVSSCQKIAPGGYILFSHNGVEHEGVPSCLRKQGIEILVDEANRAPSSDFWIILGKKKDATK